MSLFDYDDSSIDSVLKYANRELIGRTLRDLLEKYQNSEYKTYEDSCSTELNPIVPRNPIFPPQRSRLRRPLTE